MTSFTKDLSENVKSIACIPRRLNNAVLSTNSKLEIFYGTYQQVIDALDVNGIPENKVKGFAWVSSGKCVVIVHKH